MYFYKNKKKLFICTAKRCLCILQNDRTIECYISIFTKKYANFLNALFLTFLQQLLLQEGEQDEFLTSF